VIACDICLKICQLIFLSGVNAAISLHNRETLFLGYTAVANMVLEKGSCNIFHTHVLLVAVVIYYKKSELKRCSIRSNDFSLSK
jgi:hypothetical protein